MKVKQVLIVLIIVIFCSIVSYKLDVLAQADEAPKWSNFYPEEPTVVTILDPVTINVTWDDNELNTTIIWENSTGVWVSHTIGS